MKDLFAVKVNCPHCGKSLMDHDHKIEDRPGIRLGIRSGGKMGLIYMCSLYGSYDHESEIDLSTGDVAEFSCPFCDRLLTGSGSCEKCSAPLVTLNMEVGGKVNICSRKGCTEHFVAFQEIGESMRRFYDAYGM
jgi:predicted RNA-binding Zn-ribbon protein involved in translation (DUF1610 family)